MLFDYECDPILKAAFNKVFVGDQKDRQTKRFNNFLKYIEEIAPKADHFVASRQLRVGKKSTQDARGYPVFIIDACRFGSEKAEDFDGLFDDDDGYPSDNYEAPAFYVEIHNPKKETFSSLGLSKFWGQRYFFTLNDRDFTAACHFVDQVVKAIRVSQDAYFEFLRGEMLRPKHYLGWMPMTATNQILYGAAGTGKTYELQQLQQQYTETLATQDHETFLAEKLRDRSWAEVIALVFLEEGRSLRVPELIQHPLYLAKVKIHGIQKPQANAWAVLQRNAPEDSETVRVNKKSKWAWFDKDDAGLWRLLDAEREDLADLRQLLNSIQDGAQQGETIQRYRFVTFHQSYSYEDFIEGLRPVLADDERLTDSPNDGQVRYEIKQGAFVELCERARQDPAHQYAMFIDEINRGNVSKIFGELISLIELDKRAGCENALSVTLPYSKHSFSVPANVSIYGTMNSADRSLTPLDTALRRRFEFVEFMPQPELLAEREQGAEVEGVNLVALLQTLNDRIEVLLGRDYWLGHAYFWSVQTLTDLKDVMRHKIIPQLQEHCFDDWEKVRLILADNQKPDTARQFIQVKTPDSAHLQRLFGAASIPSVMPSYQVNPTLNLLQSDGEKTEQDVFLQADTYQAMY